MFNRARGLVAALLAVVLVASGDAPVIKAAYDTTREISFRHIHTGETLTVVYKKDGRFIPEALEKINWIMRDWRKNQETKMDPELIDLIWEIHTELGSKEPVNIICGYRSRETNEMLRRTVGGQASQSQHITGKAVDLTFPDIPLKQLRYSALIRERGGVGYYPTSGTPFVHIDTANVRHWPRLPRFELALLFPDGHSRHVPTDGIPITREDVRIAQATHKDVAQQIAAFFDLRSHAKSSTQIAEATPPAARAPAAARPAPVLASAGETLTWQSSARKSAVTPAPELQAAAAPAARRQVAQLEPKPQLVSAPRLVEHSSRFTPAPSDADRNRLDALVTMAAFSEGTGATPKLVAPPAPALRSSLQASLTGGMPAAPIVANAPAVAAAATKLAALSPAQTPATLSDAWGTGFVAAPAYDEEHPEELSYRPFPVAPYMTTTASVDDPALVHLTHPDVASTLDAIDDGGAILPMRMRPGAQVAKLMWAQEFRGEAADFTAMQDGQAGNRGIADHGVKTARR